MARRANEAHGVAVRSGQHGIDGRQSRSGGFAGHLERSLADHRIRFDPPATARGESLHGIDIIRAMYQRQPVPTGRAELAEIDFAEQAGFVEMLDHPPQPFRRFRMLTGAMFQEHRISEKQQPGRRACDFHVICFACLKRGHKATVRREKLLD